MSDARNIVLEKFRLLPQGFCIAAASRRETAIRTIRGVGRSSLPLPVVVRISEIYPQATIVAQKAPDLIEDLHEVTDEIVWVWFMP
jgi:hypothetical protein